MTTNAVNESEFTNPVDQTGAQLSDGGAPFYLLSFYNSLEILEALRRHLTHLLEMIILSGDFQCPYRTNPNSRSLIQ